MPAAVHAPSLPVALGNVPGGRRQQQRQAQHPLHSAKYFAPDRADLKEQ